MKLKSLIALILVAGMGSSAVAATNLPFIGTRVFDFEGGNDTEQKITIKQNGTVTLAFTGNKTMGTYWKGKFTNPLNVGGEYYRITKTTIEPLDKNKRPMYDCEPKGEKGDTVHSLSEKQHCINYW